MNKIEQITGRPLRDHRTTWPCIWPVSPTSWRAARRPAEGASRPAGQPVVQALPLRVNAVGAVFVAPLFAMNPTVTEPPAGMVVV